MLVMRACEGCRRRKIKCDAATTNTWPCSACIRLKLQCVRPNGQFDDGSDTGFEASGSSFADDQLEEAFRQAQIPLQQTQMMASASKPGSSMYAAQSAYPETPSIYQSVPYSEAATQHNLHYTTVPAPVSVIGQQFASQDVFPTPPLHAGSRADSPPDNYSDSYQQQDLADLLGSLRVNEAGTGWQTSFPCVQEWTSRVSTVRT